LYSVASIAGLIIKVLSKENNFSINYINVSNEKLVKLANELILKGSSDVKLFNEEWIKKKYRIDWKKFIDVEEIEKLISATEENTDLAKRNRCMIEVLYGCGLRVSELTELQISNINFKENYLKIHLL